METSTKVKICAICRETQTQQGGNCPHCATKKQEIMPEIGGERLPYYAKDTELQEIKVESPCDDSLTRDKGREFVDKKKKKNEGQRKWRYFPGKNRFFCNGRLITAPNISFCVCCFLLIVVTFSLFLIFDGPFLAARWSIAIPIVGSLLFLIVIVSMLKTTFSDPGIIPRASQQEAQYIERLYNANDDGRPPPRSKEVIVNGQTLKVKFCFTCKMFRPPRSSHCGVCDNCVDRFDHHCPFLGNCIGRRNYRHFYAFVLSLSFLCVFVLSCATAHLVLVSKERGNFLESLRDTPTSAVVMLISFFGMWTVLGLTGFHSYLISVEKTTNEDIKGSYRKSTQTNPFSRGNVFLNCSYILCGPVHPSLIDPRGKVTEEFLDSLPRKIDANGLQPASVCNPSSIQMQTSLKTGPQCVDGNSNRSIIMQSQQSLPSSLLAFPKTQQLQSHPTKTDDGITILRHSPDSENSLLNEKSSPNRSLGAPSESMRNLYDSLDDDPTNELSDSHLSRRNLQKPNMQGDFVDDFDDPTVFHKNIPATASLDMCEEIDIDDPVFVLSRGRVNSNPSRSKRSRAYSKTSISSIDESVTPRSSASVNNNKKATTFRAGSSGTISTNEDLILQTVRFPQSINNNATYTKSSSSNKNRSASSSSLGSRSTRNSKKLSKSTMIDSPLHLDPIT